MTADQVAATVQVIALIAGCVAFRVGLKQYSDAQAWKRQEFVAEEVRKFNDDPLVRNAMLMIDWGTRRIELFPSHPNYEERFPLVTRPLLYQALTTHDKIGRPFTTTEAAIRDAFDAFFGGLERFEQFMQAGLVCSSEFQPYVAYWVRSICDDVSPELRKILEAYVRFYRFDSVGPFFERFGKTFGSPIRGVGVDLVAVQNEYEELVENPAENRSGQRLGL